MFLTRVTALGAVGVHPVTIFVTFLTETLVFPIPTVALKRKGDKTIV